MRLQDRVALVTGAARGMGRAIALRLAREGAHLALCDLNAEGVHGVAREVRALGRECLARKADVARERDVQRLVADTIERLGRVDVLVNNAAVCRMVPIADITAGEWDRVLAVNLRSVFLFCREVFAHMRARKAGRIVNIGSAAAKLGGLAAGAHYSASKAGVLCLTKSLALQAAPYRINVNCVCPGPMQTEMTDAWGAEVNRKFAAGIPFKTYGQPEDVAAAVAFLASDEARYITGEILDVNGGLVMD